MEILVFHEPYDGGSIRENPRRLLNQVAKGRIRRPWVSENYSRGRTLPTDATKFVAKVLSDVFICGLICGEFQMPAYIVGAAQYIPQVRFGATDNEKAHM
jgi:hypothetical protein